MSSGNIAEKDAWMESRFLQVPKFIWRMTEVNGTEKGVLQNLFDRIRKKKGGGGGECFPKQSTIAKDVGISVRSVRRALTKWKDLGILGWSRVHGRTYYYILTIPAHFVEKYGDEAVGKDEIKKHTEKESLRLKEAAKVVQSASEKIRARQKIKTEELRKKIADGTFVRPEKKPVDRNVSETFVVAKHYTNVFQNKVGKTMRLTGKEMSQIKQFVALCGPDTAKNIIGDIFAKWDYYKVKWKIESDFPTVGVIVTYGKSMIVSLRSDAPARAPEDGVVDSEIELPGSGW
jgi:anti-sigma28 factor (negative regulator of flagellin synthesis)